MPPEPKTPGEIAAADQLGASFRSIAEMCWTLFDAFTDQGFTEKQAMKLTAIWLGHTTTGAKKQL